MPTITIDPDPPVQGGTLKICYDGTLPATLQIDGRPNGVWPDDVTIESSDCEGGQCCVEISVPANAESITIFDENGGADALSRIVTPS